MSLPNRIPAVSAEQMRQVDDLAEGTFHVQLIQMMENAGRSMARLARHRFMGGDVSNRQILILAGPGGNGGGGLVAARRLNGWGAAVTVVLVGDPEDLPTELMQQLRALKAASVPVRTAGEPIPQHHVILDALLGYSLQGDPRPPFDRLVSGANHSPAPVLSLDLPTGLHPDSGEPGEPTVRAEATLTLALPKTGLFAEPAAEYVGDVWLADIGIPPSLYQQMGIQLPANLFAKDDLVQLTR